MSTICEKCGRDDFSDASCLACGGKSAMACPRCRQIAMAGARFCSACGTPLETTSLQSAPGPVQADGERRQLTVLFCDLVGSTEMAGRLDEEDYREVLRVYQDTVVNAIITLKGHVAQHLGDGVVAYFGWPVALGDDPERAIRAGLEILAALERVNRSLREDRKLAARVGIHTGRAVLGEIGAGARRETAALGQTPNVAARVQSLAAEGTVVITEATNNLVGGRFAVESLGAFQMKGVTEPVVLYRVREATGVRNRLKSIGLTTPFVGRAAELEILTEHWARAARGHRQVVVVHGEPGMGKSRLVQQFSATLQAEPHTWIEGFCSPFSTDTPFAPVIEGLERAFVKPDDKSPVAAMSRIRRNLLNITPRLDATLPAIAEMLNLPLPPDRTPLLSSPDQKRKRFMAAIVDWVLEVARLQPFVVVLEDIQWSDPSTIELIQYLADRGRSSALMLLCTARPEFTAPWTAGPDCSYVELGGLSREETAGLARAWRIDAEVPNAVVELVLDRSGGVPLFIEELSRVAAARSGDVSSYQDIPATLADLLTARIDSTGSAKETAQIASVFGREFSYPMLREITDQNEKQLNASLKNLLDSGLLLASGTPPDARYMFKHALVRDVAYNSLLRTRRRALHNAAAQALAVKAEPETLAYHHTAAGNADQASRAWQLAGERASRRGALVEAAAHCAKAIELLAAIPSSDSRDQREMSLRMTEASILSATKGLAAPEAEAAYKRVRELGSRLRPNRSAALLGLWQMHVTRGEAHAAQTVAEQRLKSAESEGTAYSLCWSHLALGMTLFHRGRLAQSVDHLRAAVDCYTQGDSAARAFDAGPLAMAYLAVALVLTGDTGKARELSAASLVAARELESPPTIAYCMLNAAALHWFLKEPVAALHVASEGAEFARAHALEQMASGLDVYAGWAAMAIDNSADAPDRIRRAIAGWLTNGQRLPHAWFLSILASVCAAAGQLAEAAEIIEEAAAAVGEMVLEETIVLGARAEILERSGDWRAIEGAWNETIQSARRNGMRLYEVRGTLGLVKALAESGATEEARARLVLLTDSCEAPWKAEGLREARRLLGEPHG